MRIPPFTNCVFGDFSKEETRKRIKAPVALLCYECNELIGERDKGITTIMLDKESQYCIVFHIECHMVQIVGSVGHQLGKCSCFVKDGTAWEDPPGMTRRQAAKEASDMAAWKFLNSKLGQRFS